MAAFMALKLANALVRMDGLCLGRVGRALSWLTTEHGRGLYGDIDSRWGHYDATKPLRHSYCGRCRHLMFILLT